MIVRRILHNGGRFTVIDEIKYKGHTIYWACEGFGRNPFYITDQRKDFTTLKEAKASFR